MSSAADREFQREFGAAFLDRYWRLHPDDAIYQGYYKVADLLIVPDDTSRADLLRFLQAALARLQKIPEASLDIATQTDRAVLENQLESEIWSLTEYRSWEWNPAQYNVAEPFDLVCRASIRVASATIRMANFWEGSFSSLFARI